MLSSAISRSLVFALLLASPLRADLLLLFNFNDMKQRANTTTTATIDHLNGTPTLTLAGASLTDPNGHHGHKFTDAAGNPHPAGQAAAWSNGVNDAPPPNTFTLSLNTNGYNNLTARLDYRVTTTGPTTLSLEYRTGSNDFKHLDTTGLTKDKKFHAWSLNLASIREIQNASSAQLRWTWSTNGKANATARIDNLQLTGSPIPPR